MNLNFLTCFVLALALLESDCGNAGRSQADQRKDNRPVPVTGDRVMTSDRNDVGTIGTNPGSQVPVIKYNDGSQGDATTVSPMIVMPRNKEVSSR